MNNDLISRSALIEYCKRQATEPWNQKAAPVTWADAYVAFADDVEEDFLGVDAVEVVRCKDCKHNNAEKALRKGGIWCEYWGTDPDPDDFCKRGERRAEYTITAATITMDEPIRFEDLGQEEHQ